MYFLLPTPLVIHPYLCHIPFLSLVNFPIYHKRSKSSGPYFTNMEQESVNETSLKRQEIPVASKN